MVAQTGYYLYYPYDFEGRIYNRLGLKYYFSKQWFGAFTVKSHLATAEALEFGIGIDYNMNNYFNTTDVDVFFLR